jgi:GNAT superfamily N-acetyltransferase
MLGEAMRLVLGEDLLSVGDDVEDAAVAGDDLDPQPELSLNRGRQTGGLWPVVSTDAIGDGDVHTVTMINPRSLAGTWRPARTDEDQAVVEMSVALYGDAAAAMGITPSRVHATLRKLRAEPVRGRVLVLDSRGILAGFCLLASFWSNELGGEVCVIDELYLKEDWRGFGHATALVEALKTDRSLWPARPVAFELEVSPRNPDARRLYERLGFRDKDNATMRLALEG